jgi:hypothetical protein
MHCLFTGLSIQVIRLSGNPDISIRLHPLATHDADDIEGCRRMNTDKIQNKQGRSEIVLSRQNEANRRLHFVSVVKKVR